ncbi:efflux RND transporter periplasmic adaptor subunit [Daejeonella sp. H1SJ63]|uniref:efflux RND transporter periplasmic adaptor subunit n=1 Tax=Daejeonella sp. H1SJ63 TaxID=3034145 RepID=UPI0023EAE80E|nr:efflux RND transporter periplasmic adaptor subunit [Daejeonella sp. H1SJ63]
MIVSTRLPTYFVLFLFLACNNDKKEDHTLHNEAGNKELIRRELSLETSLKSANEYVISTIPVTAIKKDTITVEIDAMGRVEYDTRMTGSISARISGRIEKLYVRYKYQHIEKGQKIMDVYSPELLTAQQNLLFVTKNDAANSSLISAARQKLLLLGMNPEQIQNVLQTGKPLLAVSIYSGSTGHLHNTSAVPTAMAQQTSQGSMESTEPSTELLNLKEGMYIQKGQTLFSIYNPSKAWALLNIYTDRQALIKKGQLVNIYPESSASQSFQGHVDFIEPFYRDNSRTTSVRVYFDNSILRLPVGSQVRGRISANMDMANWLPKESVISLGIDKIVLLKAANGFSPKKVITGITSGKNIQIIRGISESDSVALNAQYLIDSESFIKVKE